MNRFKNLRSFLKKWDEPMATNGYTEEVKISSLGNINITGSEANGSASHTLTKNHPAFYSFIEAGVRELVKALIEKFNCITYSSCEGHPSVPGKTVFEPRHIGIIPRSYEEYLLLHRGLVYLTSLVNAEMCRPSSSYDVYIVTRIEPIESDDGPDMYGLDMYFYKMGDDEKKYFTDVAVATDMLTGLLNEYSLSTKTVSNVWQ